MEPVEEIEERVIYTFSGDDTRFKFPRSASSLTQEFRDGLEENVIQPLTQNPRNIVVEGHASPDNSAINMELSGKRAISVSDYVELNVPASVDIQEVRCGQQYPVFLDDGSYNRPASQRVIVEYAEGYELPEGCEFIVR